MWGRWVLAAVVVGALVLTACGGGDSKDSASDAARRDYDQVDKQQWGKRYDSIHPAQRAVIPRALYLDCAAKRVQGASVSIKNVKVLETYQEKINIPGTDQHDVDSTAVTVEYEGVSGLLSQKTKDTVHFVKVDDAWFRTVPDPAPYQQGKCPE